MAVPTRRRGRGRLVRRLSLGAALAAAGTAVRTSPHTLRLLRRVSWVAAGVLLARGGLGTLLLLIDLAAKNLDPAPPLLLLLVEPGFLLGGLAFAAVAHTATGSGRPAAPTEHDSVRHRGT